MRIVFVLCILLCSSIANAATVSFFDQKPLYSEPFAGPRSIDTGLTINTAKYKKQQIGYLEASLGRNLPIATFNVIDDVFVQIGIAAGFWATLGYDDGVFPLLTQDFVMAVPLEFKYKKFTGAIKFNHISAHLGDGFDRLLKEELSPTEQRDLEDAEDLLEDYAATDDIGITLMEPFSYSRDFMTVHAAYEDKFGIVDLKLYGHFGYVHKMIPDDLARYFFGSGIEAVYKLREFSPYYVSDFTYHQDTNSTDFSSELGAIVLSNKTKYFSLRVAFTIFLGKDRRGQLVGNRLKQFGFGFFIY